MISTREIVAKYGQPGGKNEGQYMTRWTVPADIRKAFAHVFFTLLGTKGFPAAIYCHVLLKVKLEKALRNVIDRGLAHEMHTWDGCYIIRNSRGSKSWSKHAWGLAIDLNANSNRMGVKPTLSADFVRCFTDAGFIWGGTFSGARIDGMHFELADLNEAPTAPISHLQYTVRSGDTLGGIAKANATTIERLISINNIFNANSIRVGQKLFL